MKQSHSNALICLSLPLFLIACGTERIVTKPEVVRVTETEFVPVPADLTALRDVSVIPEGATYAEVILHCRQDRETVGVLNAQLEAISQLE